ncbi:MAG TPA: DUF294 nucleotidyltransferase-like domain-containing protein, partial [Longimicrobium sp.]|nr:DUF294 nucleotidyltransferase-like domain-containing protein [Longimicrobium sp.]
MRGDLALGIDAPSELEALRIELGAEWPAIRASRERAIQLFATLRAELVGCAPADTSIIVFGSLARLETTSGSDVDWTLLVDGAADPQHLDAALEIERRLRELGVRPPGREGTFGGLAFSHDLLHNIGGEDDTNR